MCNYFPDSAHCPKRPRMAQLEAVSAHGSTSKLKPAEVHLLSDFSQRQNTTGRSRLLRCDSRCLCWWSLLPGQPLDRRFPKPSGKFVLPGVVDRLLDFEVSRNCHYRIGQGLNYHPVAVPVRFTISLKSGHFSCVRELAHITRMSLAQFSAQGRPADDVALI